MSDRRVVSPKADIFENDDKFELVLEVPGIDPGSVDIELKEDSLSIQAKGKEVDEKWQAIRREFSVVDYARTFSLGQRIDRNSIQARYDNGILTVEMNKTPEAKPRKITVNAA